METGISSQKSLIKNFHCWQQAFFKFNEQYQGRDTLIDNNWSLSTIDGPLSWTFNAWLTDRRAVSGLAWSEEACLIRSPPIMIPLFVVENVFLLVVLGFSCLKVHSWVGSASVTHDHVFGAPVRAIIEDIGRVWKDPAIKRKIPEDAETACTIFSTRDMGN